MDDHFNILTDSDHHGDKLMTSKSQTGVMVLAPRLEIHSMAIPSEVVTSGITVKIGQT